MPGPVMAGWLGHVQPEGSAPTPLYGVSDEAFVIRTVPFAPVYVVVGLIVERATPMSVK